jgi:hypothetical protein
MACWRPTIGAEKRALMLRKNLKPIGKKHFKVDEFLHFTYFVERNRYRCRWLEGGN